MHPHITHLSRDKKMLALMGQSTLEPLAIEKNICLELCSSIMGQQLSVKVAAVIRSRFLELFASKSPQPQDILAVPFDRLKSIGLSGSKTTYIHNVCAFFIENKLTDRKLHRMSDQEVLDLLTQIKGVGEWTVQMLLMFTMGREDVFAPDDLGIRQAMIRHYKIKAEHPREIRLKMLALAAKWQPYRSFACRYLWNWKDQ